MFFVPGSFFFFPLLFSIVAGGSFLFSQRFPYGGCFFSEENPWFVRVCLFPLPLGILFSGHHAVLTLRILTTMLVQSHCSILGLLLGSVRSFIWFPMSPFLHFFESSVHRSILFFGQG